MQGNTGEAGGGPAGREARQGALTLVQHEGETPGEGRTGTERRIQMCDARGLK